MKRKIESTKTPISSLIDVVFLLIMFFVITSVISGAEIPVDLTKAENMKPGKSIPNFVILTVARDGSVFIDDSRIPYNADSVTGNLIHLVNLRGNALVATVRADKETSHENVDKVLKAVKKSGISKIRIMAELKEKER